MTPESEAVDFVYRIEGDNQLDLDELIPILTSLGEVVQEGNRVLNPETEDIAISVKPFQEGSFDIEMLLSPATATALFAAFQTSGIQQIFTVLDRLGVIASKTMNLLGLLKKLKGEPPKQIKEVGRDKFEVTTRDGEVVQINDQVHRLYQNCAVIENLTIALGEPLKKPRRKKVQTYLKGQPDSVVEVRQEEAKAITEAKAPEPEAPAVAESENTSEVFLSPKRGSFEGEGGKWSFRKGGRQGEVIQANIKDTDFLHRLETGEYRLSGNDILKVQLHEKQRLVGTDLHTTNEILKVTDYKPAPKGRFPKQTSLFDEHKKE